MATPNEGAAPSGQTAPESGQATENSALQEYKQFFDGISPLLEKLDKNPELVQAIMDGKIDADLAKAALEGKLSVKEAEAATAAAAEVKQEVGEKAFNNLSADALAKLMDDKIAAVKTELSEKDSIREFEQYTNNFISSTPDFEKYSDSIGKWLDEHDVTDIRIAYYAVKGELSEKEAKAASEAAAAENAKNVILNASGGGVTAQTLVGGIPLIDQLIASRSNPNHL